MHLHDYFGRPDAIDNATWALDFWKHCPERTIWTTGVGTYVVAEEGWSPPAEAYQVSPEELEKLLKA